MQTVSLEVKPRKETGKKSTKVVRAEGGIPCVMYGGKEVFHFSTTPKAVKGLVYTPDFKVATVELDGVTHKCVVRDVQFHPVSERIMHMDFLRLVEGTEINVEVPVRFKGDSPGVKIGGKLMQNLRRVKVKTTPENLVDQVMLDISNVELGQAIRVRDIEIPEGVVIMNSPSIPVASVEVPRALRSATAAAEAEETTEAEA